jgi:hypothetical protein
MLAIKYPKYLALHKIGFLCGDRKFPASRHYECICINMQSYPYSSLPNLIAESTLITTQFLTPSFFVALSLCLMVEVLYPLEAGGIGRT